MDQLALPSCGVDVASEARREAGRMGGKADSLKLGQGGKWREFPPDSLVF